VTPPSAGPPPTSGATVAQIKALLARVTVPPPGKGALIGAVLKAGGYTFTIASPGPGGLVVSWYRIPPGGHLSRAASKPKPILVATGRVRLTGGKGSKLKLSLTPAGRRILKQTKHALRLTAKATFTDPARKLTAASRRFTLTR
jgi:hypothetical protein